MTPDALIFDCDGTLVDSEGLQAEVFSEFAAAMGGELSAADALAAFRGRRFTDCMADLEARFGALRPNFEPAFRARTAVLLRERLREIDGASAMLAALTLPMCVASNAPRAKLELCLATTGLARFFGDRVFSAYEVGRWKPDPGLFLHAAQAMGVEPSRCLVVEDSEPGVVAALAAGMQVAVLLHEPAPAWLPAAALPMRSLAELPGLLAMHAGG